MPGGFSEYRWLELQREHDKARADYWQRTLGLQSPWQNDYQPIRAIKAINPPPPYHWLGRDAETVA